MASKVSFLLSFLINFLITELCTSLVHKKLNCHYFSLLIFFMFKKVILICSPGLRFSSFTFFRKEKKSQFSKIKVLSFVFIFIFFNIYIKNTLNNNEKQKSNYWKNISKYRNSNKNGRDEGTHEREKRIKWETWKIIRKIKKEIKENDNV